MKFIKNYILKKLVRGYPFIKGKSRLLGFAQRYISGISINRDAFGNKLLLDLMNYIDSRIYLEGTYEKDEILALKKQIQDRDIKYFVDIGANIGLYTLTIAACSSVKTVFSFEPDPRNYCQLLCNVFMNNQYNKVITHNIALDSKQSRLKFYISRNCKYYDYGKFNTGTSSLIHNPSRHEESIEIQTRALDEILQFSNERIAIKIDVEGFEYDVLLGMKQLLKTNLCIIQVESIKKHEAKVRQLLNDLRYCELNIVSEDKNNHLYVPKNEY